MCIHNMHMSSRQDFMQKMKNCCMLLVAPSLFYNLFYKQKTLIRSMIYKIKTLNLRTKILLLDMLLLDILPLFINKVKFLAPILNN